MSSPPPPKRPGRQRSSSSSVSKSEIAEALTAQFSDALSGLQALASAEDVMRTEVIDKLEKRLLQAVDSRVAAVKDTIVEEMDRCRTSLCDDVRNSVQGAQPPSAQRPPFLSEKEFRVRDSVLTDMLAKPDFQSIYNLFVAVAVWLAVNIVLQEWFENNRLVDTTILFYAFGQFGIVVPFWFGMQAWSMLVVPLVQFIQRSHPPVSLWLSIYGFLQLPLLLVPSWFALSRELPPASGLIVMCEMARFWMKTHSYLREKLLYGYRAPSSVPTTKAAPSGPAGGKPPKSPSKGSTPPASSPSQPPLVFAKYADFLPEKSKRAGVTLEDLKRPSIKIHDLQTEIGLYMYFLFAPTLIYRDTYPRSGSEIRWITAFTHLLNLLGVMGYIFLMFQTFCVPYFAETGQNPGDLKTFILSVFRSMMPAMGVFLMVFFGVLHSWFNFWAELLRFGDRRFYDDWWNSKSFGSYYRRWNAVVHEWLFAYLYQDCVRFSLGRFTRTVGTALVFVISAIVHEQIIACAMGFFYPVLLLMFGGPGVFFVQLTKQNTRFYNIFMWLMLSVGNGLLLVLYSREWYARVGDLRVNFGGMDEGILYFVPRSWLAFYQERYLSP